MKNLSIVITLNKIQLQKDQRHQHITRQTEPHRTEISEQFRIYQHRRQHSELITDSAGTKKIIFSNVYFVHISNVIM